MFPSPPPRVFLRRHVYDWHDVSHLMRRARSQPRGYNGIRSLSELLGDGRYLEGELICGLGCVTFGDVRSGDGRDVDRGFLRHQQVVALVVDLGGKTALSSVWWREAFWSCFGKNMRQSVKEQQSFFWSTAERIYGFLLFLQTALKLCIFYNPNTGLFLY